MTKGIPLMTYPRCSLEEIKHQHTGPLSGEMCLPALEGKHEKGQGRRGHVSECLTHSTNIIQP